MVRNEADIIEESIRHLFRQGIDGVLVADNGSTDGTGEKLRSLSTELNVHVASDGIAAHWQSAKMTRLSKWAIAEGAEWVVPFDADEFWFGPPGMTLAEYLASVQHDVVQAAWYQFRPVAEKIEPQFLGRFPYRDELPDDLCKVAFRRNALAVLGNGNHRVMHPGPVTDGLRIAHYRYRSLDQMRAKVRGGAAALSLTDYPVHLGGHWREAAALSDDELELMWSRDQSLDGAVFDPASEW
jgi:glycosyltransferase involved in cell wall biosynthesis